MDRITHRLVLDIGNSRMKAGLFASQELVGRADLDHGDLPGVRELLGDRRVDRVVVGAVAAEDPSFMEALQALAPVQLIDGRSPSRLRNGYGTPESLGADRWANAVAAARLFPGRAALAIALGTCAVYDLVDEQGTYQGGLISPGIRMRARAMHEFTARLPDVSVDETPVLVGRSTTQCIASGAYHGLLGELRATIASIKQQHPSLAVVLTGGDGLRFAKALENGIFAHPSLTLIGLHALSHSDHLAGGAPPAR